MALSFAGSHVRLTLQVADTVGQQTFLLPETLDAQEDPTALRKQISARHIQPMNRLPCAGKKTEHFA